MSKPATDAVATPSRWTGTPNWYLWDGGFIALGRSEGIIPSHDHHAIQIVVTIEGNVGIQGAGGDWRMAPGVIVRPDVVHSYNGNGAVGAMLFVDPESAEGVWLRASLREDITIVPEARIAPCAAELSKFLERPLEG
ncbi:MAG TPA: AraC family ligand binding domain-containing protein, partial [Vicinamibacterales bacterium]|nr:AraC family ligand binding domain-containing protein [Vicinamibacterales bacterium]